MGRGKRNRDRGGAREETDWSTERTLADVEAEAAEAAAAEAAGAPPEAALTGGFDASPRDRAATAAVSRSQAARCACGSEEFLLEAYLAVVRGRPQPEPVEMESMTCPQCGREYEAIWLEGGTIARGEFRGQTDLEE